jgi:hypothetical protein
MGATITRKNYAVLLRCPQRDEDTWVVLENRTETLEEILRTPVDFECSVHGVQREIPVAANEKGPPVGQRSQKRASGQDQRSSARLMLRVPVQVYGWVRSKGAFHEETHTSVVNSGGCLVKVSTPVEIGDMLFLVNRVSQKELQCRVAYVEHGGLEASVGLAFKTTMEGFWRINRQRPRVAKAIQVWVRGVDRKGDPFVQSAYTIDISDKGARLDGLGGITGRGETIEVKNGWHKARYRVVWIGPPGTPQANQVGICCMESSGKHIWGTSLPEK